MRTVIRKIGDAAGVAIPDAMLRETGLAAGDTVDLSLQDGRITIKPTKRRPREGWAQASEEIGAIDLTDEDKAWIEFGNTGDAELGW